MEHSLDNTSQDKTRIHTKDIAYVFAVILLLVSCFDLIGNVFRFGIFFGIFNDILHVTETNEPIFHLILNFGAQIGAIIGFTILYRYGRIEPEEKTTPKGQHILTTYLLHAMNIFLIFIILLPIDTFLKEQGFTTESPYDTISPTAVLANDPVFLFLFFSVFAIGAPIWEELVFRRTLIPLFERRGIGQAWALIFSSLLFSLQHTPTDLYNGSLGFAIEHFISTLLGGLLLGFLYLKTRNILWPILFHAGTNGFAALSQFSDIDLPEVGSPIITVLILSWTLIALGVGAAASIYFLIQLLQKNKDKYKPIWIQIITETKDKSGALFSFSFFLIGFIVVSGAVPIFLDLVGDVLIPESEALELMFYLIQVSFFVAMIVVLTLIVFKVTPITHPLFVSDSVEEDNSRILLHQPDFIPTVISDNRERCYSCGNILLPNAKFCAFCGSEL
ncbi:hypothetical protein CEE45_10200 [Candidatus Heimdallarchaeota archaeon B3_Heim]|nr:MAG: hypothetical protein CEE45_10200 [Candidatus Heimdallarchaeota archaeon B3_Heim]